MSTRTYAQDGVTFSVEIEEINPVSREVGITLKPLEMNGKPAETSHDGTGMILSAKTGR
jgi:hypothetical protein